jgi:hypothetical protein
VVHERNDGHSHVWTVEPTNPSKYGLILQILLANIPGVVTRMPECIQMKHEGWGTPGVYKNACLLLANEK